MVHTTRNECRIAYHTLGHAFSGGVALMIGALVTCPGAVNVVYSKRDEIVATYRTLGQGF